MFYTEVKLSKPERQINISNRILAIGSCFAQNVGSKFSDYKFHVNSNPFGTLFNPISIFKLVNQAVLREIIASMGIVEQQGVYHHYDLHSDLSDINEQDLLDRANEKMHKLGEQLNTTDVIIYTFGTAIVYERMDTGEIVANCHKIPAKSFKRRMLEIDEIVHSFKVNYDLIKSINKDVLFFLTVSPVRHQKESFEQNNVSKSVLRVAVEKIRETFNAVEYFPAFEIMMDELRDYRFYAEDMLHPNQVAIDHIWEKFAQTYFDGETLDFIEKWEKIRKAMAHKPFHVASQEYRKFIIKTIEQIREFSNVVDVENEIYLLKSRLL